MKPCVYSKRRDEAMKCGWHRNGFDISYRRNPTRKTPIITKAIDEIKNEDLKREFYKRMKVLHTLTFKYTFEYENDIVFFAHFFPYTFTDLERYLAKITSREEHKKYLRIDILCKSLSNNPCYMLTITNKIRTYLGSQDEAILLKKSNAARTMMKRKMERIEALKSNVKIQKEASVNNTSTTNNNQANVPRRDSSNSHMKK